MSDRHKKPGCFVTMVLFSVASAGLLAMGGALLMWPLA